MKHFNLNPIVQKVPFVIHTYHWQKNIIQILIYMAKINLHAYNKLTKYSQMKTTEDSMIYSIMQISILDQTHINNILSHLPKRALTNNKKKIIISIAHILIMLINNIKAKRRITRKKNKSIIRKTMMKIFMIIGSKIREDNKNSMTLSNIGRT